MAAFVAWESRTATPMIPLGFFRRPDFSAPVMLVAFVGLALFGVVFFITLYFQNVKGWSPTEAGVRTLPLTMMVMIVGPLAGRLQKRFSARGMMTLGHAPRRPPGLVGLSQIQVDSSYNADLAVLRLYGWSRSPRASIATYCSMRRRPGLGDASRRRSGGARRSGCGCRGRRRPPPPRASRRARGAGRRARRPCSAARRPGPSGRRPRAASTAASPPGRMRPSAMSSSARSRLSRDHVLRGPRGVNRCSQCAVVLARRLAVDPPEAEGDVERLGVGQARDAGALLREPQPEPRRRRAPWSSSHASHSPAERNATTGSPALVSIGAGYRRPPPAPAGGLHIPVTPGARGADTPGLAWSMARAPTVSRRSRCPAPPSWWRMAAVRARSRTAPCAAALLVGGRPGLRDRPRPAPAPRPARGRRRAGPRWWWTRASSGG